MVDFVQMKEPLDFEYMIEHVFETWPEDVVWDAIHELADCDIMFIDFNDPEEETDEDDCECEEELLLFNPKFLDKTCPYIGCCTCCNPAPANFNVIYN